MRHNTRAPLGAGFLYLADTTPSVVRPREGSSDHSPDSGHDAWNAEGAPFTFDGQFEDLCPEWLRVASRTHFTPTDVADVAIRFLAKSPRGRVLDIGSGAGKVCILGALRTQAHFTGLEHRVRLVDVAEEQAKNFGARVTFVRGRLEQIAFEDFDAFYLYNPFWEHLANPEERLDSEIEFSRERCRADIALVEQGLARAAVGTRVATYHGFGGTFPPGYEHAVPASQCPKFLTLWEKRSL